jgi:type II secretory pathway predicted ATPase ExeA
MTCLNRLARGEKMSMQRISRDVLAEKYAKGDETTIDEVLLRVATALARALGTVSATYLLCLDDEERLADDERRLLERFRNLDERGRAAMLAVAEAEGRRR